MAMQLRYFNAETLLNNASIALKAIKKREAWIFFQTYV